MRWITPFAARNGADSVAGGAEDGRRGSALAEALAIVACTFDYSHPIAPERHQFAEREPVTPDGASASAVSDVQCGPE